MRLKLPADAQPREIPVVTIAVIVVCVGVWLAQVTRGMPVMGGHASAMIDWGACVPLYVLTGEPWRLVSATFLHFDIVHLGLNMLIFGGTAPQVERAFGSLRTLTIFLVGGILANAGFVEWADLNGTPAHFGHLLVVLGGASGGLMALLGALLVPSLLGAIGQEPYSERYGGRVHSGLLLSIGINIGICFVIPNWDPTINIAGALAGVVLGTILLAAPAHVGTAAGLLRFAAVGLLLAACVSGVAHGGERDFLARLRGEYNVWRVTHP